MHAIIDTNRDEQFSVLGFNYWFSIINDAITSGETARPGHHLPAYLLTTLANNHVTTSNNNSLLLSSKHVSTDQQGCPLAKLVNFLYTRDGKSWVQRNFFIESKSISQNYTACSLDLICTRWQLQVD